MLAPQHREVDAGYPHRIYHDHYYSIDCPAASIGCCVTTRRVCRVQRISHTAQCTACSVEVLTVSKEIARSVGEVFIFGEELQHTGIKVWLMVCLCFSHLKDGARNGRVDNEREEQGQERKCGGEVQLLALIVGVSHAQTQGQVDDQ